MPDVQEVFRMATQKVRPDPGALERQNRNQRRRVSRERRGGYALAAALVIAGTVIGITVVRQGDERPGTRPTEPAEQPDIPPRIRGAPPTHGVPKVDYVIDLNTEEMTPLPETIIRTLGEAGEGGWPAWIEGCMSERCSQSHYVVSPDGSLLAYVGTGDEGTPQIFIAGIDGTGVRQMTHDPTGAIWPAWSPDGTMIAFAKVGTEGPMGLFVLDVATGESTQVTDEAGMIDGLQFTPDGASLLYTGSRNPEVAELRTVPIAGGSSTLLLGPEGDAPGDLGDVVNGSLSPDGSLLTFAGPGLGLDVQRWVANADGTELRLLPGCYDSIPAGTWSPDGSRIVCNHAGPPGYRTILVIDVATGDARRVARGSAAIWLDDHTLLVEV